MFISSRGNVHSKTFSKMLVKYTVLDEQRREAKEGQSQRQNPRSITRGARNNHTLTVYCTDTIHLYPFI